MLNDVHAPPPDPNAPPTPPTRGVHAKHPVRVDRAHSLERAADHHGGTNLVFSDPEDRGDSFNTIMSAAIVGGALAALAVIAYVMYR